MAFRRLLLLIILIVLSAPFITEGQVLQDTFVAWSPDGSMLAVGVGSTVQIVDVATMQPLNTFTELKQQATEAAWSPDGTYLAVANGTDVDVWNQPWDTENARFSLTYQYYAVYNPPIGGSYISAMAWSPNGNQIALSAGEFIDVVEFRTGGLTYNLHHVGNIHDLDWSTDSTLASGGGFSGTVTIWNMDTGEVIRNLILTAEADIPENFPGTYSIAWSPDKEQIAVGVTDSTIRVWDTTAGEFWSESTEFDRDVLKGHTEPILAVAWSSDGQYIASGSQDGTLRLWDVATDEQLAMIEASGFVHSVAFSPDGSRLAYGQGDGTFHVVEVSELLPSA